jgi:DnaJ-domain-containing protein 1/ribonuclease HI
MQASPSHPGLPRSARCLRARGGGVEDEPPPSVAEETAHRERREVVFVAVNVGTIAYSVPSAGGAAHGTSGTFSRHPISENMNRLLEQMLPQHRDGTKRVAMWVLSSTCLPKRDVQRAIVDFSTVGYTCVESHGERGDRRSEIAGVIICIDAKQLAFVPIGLSKRSKRVVRRGRILRVRLRIVGAESRAADFDVIGCYMPTRTQSRRGGQASAAASRAYSAAVWRSLAVTAMPLAAHGRLLVMGDLNAEAGVSLRRAGRRQQPNDAALDHLLDMSRLSRVHDEREWTYTSRMHGATHRSTIDHVLASDSMRVEVVRARTVDGVETGEKRHRALEAALQPGDVQPLAMVGEQRVAQASVCTLGAGRDLFEACKSDFAEVAAGGVENAVAIAGGWNSPAHLLLPAMQDGMTEAMAMALPLANAGRGRGARQRQPSSRRARAVFWEMALLERRDDIGADPASAPSTLHGWRDKFISIERARQLPQPYASFHSESETGRRVANVYGTSLKVQMLNGMGGECASAADAQVRPTLTGDPPPAWTARGERTILVLHDASAAADAARDEHYAVLGVATGASTAAVQAAYRRQSLLWHPDRHVAGSQAARSRAEEQFKRVNNAYSVLSDVHQRAQYDARRSASNADGTPYCNGGSGRQLSVAGLRLARQRWRLEHTTVIDAMMPSIGALADEEHEQDRESFYERRMQRGAARGASESVVYGLVYAHNRELAGRTAPLPSSQRGKLSAVTIVEAGREELVYQPARVRRAVRDQMVSSGEATVPYSIHGMRAMLAWAKERGMRVTSAHVDDVDDGAWLSRVFSIRSLQRALQRMRPRGQAAGADGWLGVMLRWAPLRVQQQYLEQIKRAAAELHFPITWPVNLVTHVPKPGKSVTMISKMRDLWNCPHGWKICTQMLREEYNRVSDDVMPGCQRGFRAFCDAGEAASIAVYHTEEASTLCATLGRVYVDLSGFFMNVQRELLYALEGDLGVAPGVTACMKAVHDVMVGRADTAFGLSDVWSVLKGTGQGCINAPVRSTLQLIVTIYAIERFGGGHCYQIPAGAVAACVTQAWFADDLNSPAAGAQSVQLNFEGADLGSWIAGNQIGVAGRNDASKTAYELSTCDADGFSGDDGYDIRLPGDVHVPRVKAADGERATYRLLGHEMGARVGNPATVESFVYRAGLCSRLFGRLGGLSLKTYARVADCLISSLASYYAGPSPVDWTQAERVDLERRKAVRRLGMQAPRGPLVQLYAPRRAGGMQQRHTYVHTGAASVLHVDKGLRAAPGDGHGMAAQAAIALRAHQLGFVPSRVARTPLDWQPVYAVGKLQSERSVDAWWAACMCARLHTRHTGALAGTRLPLDPELPAWAPPLDGGGPVVWQLVGDDLFSLELSSAGIVRLIDLYGGRSDGAGYWADWDDVVADGWYVPPDTPDDWKRVAAPAYRALVAAVDGCAEARRWLQWFAPLQDDDDPPREHAAVEWRMLEAHSVVGIAGVKETGRRDGRHGGVEYLCTWRGLPEDERTWQEAPSVVAHWGRHTEWPSEAARLADAHEAMRSAAAAGAAPFHMERAIDAALKASGYDGDWQSMRRRSSPDDAWVDVVLAAAEAHKHRVSQPHPPERRNAAADHAHVDALRWEAVASQRVFLGHLRGRDDCEAGPAPGAAEELESDEAGDGQAGPATEQATDEAELESLRPASGAGSEPSDEGTGPRGFHPHAPPAEERWPVAEGRRVPSLAPPDEASAADGAVVLLRTPSQLRNSLSGAAEQATVWGWSGRASDGATGGQHPVVRLYRRAWQLETAWTPGAAVANARNGWQRAIWRGVRRSDLSELAQHGLRAHRHTGGVAQHAADIAGGSRHATAGLSLTKDPAIAARYAAQSRGEVVAIAAMALRRRPSAVREAGLADELRHAGADADELLFAEAGSVDFSGGAGAAALRAAGADERTMQYAASDAEWRHGGRITASALVSDAASGAPLTLDAAAAAAGDGEVPHVSYEASMPPWARDALADFASASEGKGPAWRVDGGGPSVRLEWREARGMSDAATASMAHMSLTLHDTFGFTDACATDGSFLPSGESGEGAAAWAVWYGVADDGRPRAEGGSLPAGSSIADAEMTAVDACMAHADAVWRQRPDGSTAPRLLVLSDCTAVVISIDAALQMGSAYRLFKQHRAGLLERIALRAKAWRQQGGELVLQWTPAHRGVFPNHYADVVAKAFLERGVAAPYDQPLARRATPIAYGPTLADGSVSWAAGQRRLLGLVQVGLQQYSLRRAISTAKHDVGALVLYLPRELPHAWPWDSVWTAVLDATSQSSDGGGSKLQATSLGATMRLRSGQLGLGELDYARDGGADSVAALASVWRSGDSGARLAVQLQSQLEAMAGAIATPVGSAPGDSELQRAIAGAQAAVTAMAAAGMPLPAAEEWRGLRAAVSGALPRPSRREQAATRARAAVVQSVAPPATGGRDADRLSAMQIAARAVTAGARAASRAVCETAARWRKEHAPAWRGGAAGELDGDDDDDLDDDGDDEGDPVPEEEPTDDEGAGEEWDRRRESGRGAGSGSGGAGRSNSGRGSAGRGTGGAGAGTAGEQGGGGSGDGEPSPPPPSVRVVVAGSRRVATYDPGAGVGRHNEPITRTEGGALCNPFPMGGRGNDGGLRCEVCEAYQVWLRLRTVVAADLVSRGDGAPPLIVRSDGSPFDARIAPRRAQAQLTGADAVAAMRRVLNERRRGARVSCASSARRTASEANCAMATTSPRWRASSSVRAICVRDSSSGSHGTVAHRRSRARHARRAATRACRAAQAARGA